MYIVKIKENSIIISLNTLQQLIIYILRLTELTGFTPDRYIITLNGVIINSTLIYRAVERHAEQEYKRLCDQYVL